MHSLKITLRHGDLMEMNCSAIFLKHIEGSMSAPELALNAAVHGKLEALHSRYEKEEHSILETQGLISCPRVYIVNFHKEDLPFTYHSVDRYARSILQTASTGGLADAEEPITVATAVHGPGAGLDASEAMETLLLGFRSELGMGGNFASLEGIMLVERDMEVFKRLEERLKYLSGNNVVRFAGGTCFIDPEAAQEEGTREQGRVDRLSLKHLFVAMPYAKAFDNAYYFGIKQPIEQRGRKCERVDQDVFTGDIVERLKHRISSSELVIADITGNNPNVFFEVGYAEGVGKGVILLSQDQDTPFDLKTCRQIRYDAQDILSLAKSLGEHLDALVGTET